jgi:hypothetical protein
MEKLQEDDTTKKERFQNEIKILDDEIACLADSIKTGIELLQALPRSIVTDSVYMLYTLRIRPYFAVLHDPVLRPYISVAEYGEVRRP